MTESITIELPKPLAIAARTNGLLAPSSLEQLLRRELTRKSFARNMTLRRLPGRPPTDAELEREIGATRKARQRK